MASGGFIKQLRILFLLFVLFIVGIDTWLTKLRSTDWDQPLHLVIYPVNGDQSEVAAQYIKQLSPDAFVAIEQFMQEEAAHYKLPLSKPVAIRLSQPVSELPPKPPANGNMLKVMWWSLRLRYWVFSVDNYSGPSPDVRIFVVYLDPEKTERPDHSLGLDKGLIGVVNVFAQQDREEQNNIVIAHEFLHTVGATDKYDLMTGLPLYPEGFVDLAREPLYPQEFAELMAGTVPVSTSDSVMPQGLYQTVVGKKTAREINWIK